MAGLGSRFSDAGYLLPKPLIPVSGVPMILQVIRRLPAARAWIFIVRQEHIDEYAIDQVIKGDLPDATIIAIDTTTEGQASTCMLALDQIADNSEDILIAACDNTCVYDAAQFDTLRNDESVDAIVWSFTDDPLLEAKPEAWGWLKLAEDSETITDVSVKVPVSDDPRHDHAVTATFYFKRAFDFTAAYDAMYTANYRINNEFYVDALPIFLNQLGRRSVAMDVSHYISWGKPADIYLYDHIEHLCRVGKCPDKEWEKFF